MIRKITIFSILMLLMFGFVFVYAEEPPVECVPNGCNDNCPVGCDQSQDPDCNPNGCCGDNIVQSPNGDNPVKYEKCDEGGVDSESCTETCGQKMLGWAWADTFGWLSLNSDNCQDQYLDPKLSPKIVCRTTSTPHYVQATENNAVFGWAWSDNVGWVCFGQSCLGSPPVGDLEINIDFEYDLDNPQLVGWVKVLSMGNEGWFSLNCENDSSCDIVEYRTQLTLGDFNEEQRLTPKSFAWNGATDSTGMGWLWFEPEISEIPPWLQTKYGDIYARQGLTAEEEAPGYNATYRILSGGDIKQFRSAKGSEWWVSELFGPINFPTPETRYSNILGRLDISSLLCEFQGGLSCINNQGKTVVDLNRSPLLDQSSGQAFLGGNIYFYQGNLNITSEIELMNAIGFSNSSGTIIIDGDLTIDANIIYDPSDALTRFRNLASVAWIVTGDLNISSNVEELAGNFIIIGDGNNCNSDPEIHVIGCGEIDTCYQNDSGCSQHRLTVNGLMMARKFNLNRTYTAKYEVPVQGSEVILYDGRLLANTPPGLGDFAAALPIWRSGIFSR